MKRNGYAVSQNLLAVSWQCYEACMTVGLQMYRHNLTKNATSCIEVSTSRRDKVVQTIHTMMLLECFVSI